MRTNQLVIQIPGIPENGKSTDRPLPRETRTDAEAAEGERSDGGGTLAHAEKSTGGLGTSTDDGEPPTAAPGERNQDEEGEENPNPTPERLNDEDWETERAARSDKKRNVMIRGLALTSGKKRAELEAWAQDALQIDIRGESLERLDKGEQGWRVKLATMQQKLALLRSKARLAERGWDVGITDDLTNRQKVIQSFLEREAHRWRTKGKQANSGSTVRGWSGTRTEENFDRQGERRHPPFPGAAVEEEERQVAELTLLHWNVQGKNNIWKNKRMWRAADIVSFQETFIEEGNLKKELGKLDSDFQWTGKGAVRCHKNGRASGGHVIGVKRSLGMKYNVSEWANGLILQTTEGNGIEYTIITAYNNDRNELKKTLKELDAVLEELEGTGGHVLIAGDLNAKVGELNEVASCGLVDDSEIPPQKAKDLEIREEGRTLVKWSIEKAFVILNGRAEGDEEGNNTCIGHGAGLGGTLDLILAKLEEPRLPEYFRGLKVAAQEGSDHLPVFYRLKRSRGAHTDGPEPAKTPKRKLKWKEHKIKDFQEEWLKCWNGERKREERSPSADWDRLTRTTNKAAKRTGMMKGPTRRGKNEGWITDDYTTLRRRLFKLLHRFKKRRDWKTKAQYLNCRRELAEKRACLIDSWRKDKQRRVAKSKNLSEWWKAMNWFRRNKRTTNNVIKQEEWRAHFMELLESTDRAAGEGTQNNQRRAGGLNPNPNPENTCYLINKDLRQEEIIKVIRDLKTGKAAGEDGIQAEFLKSLRKEGIHALIDTISDLWQQQELIEDWRVAMIYPIHKKGDVNLAKNYRGVSLLDVGYKIFTTIMARRLITWLEREGKLSEAQAGFRSGRGTMEQAFVLNTIIDNRLKRKGGKLHVAFIDFKAAFDKVDRGRLWEKMERLGIQGRFLENLKLIYGNTYSQVIAGEGLTGRFETGKGVRQGCPLSPILFNIYIDDLEEDLRKAGEGGVLIGNRERVFALLYADDAAIVAEDAEDLRKMLRTVERWADRNKMEVSVEKTKLMVFRNGGKRRREEWCYKGKQLEVVKEFKYLGFWFAPTNQHNTHTRMAAGKAQLMTNKVWSETKRAKISNLRKKLYFMESTVKAAALYGAEIWGWKRRAIMEKLQGRYTKASMGLTRTTPDYIWRMESGTRSIRLAAVRRAGAFVKKTAALPNSRWAKKCLREEMRGILNGVGSRWGQDLINTMGEEKAFKIAKMIRDDREIGELEKELDDLYGRLEEQEIKADWAKIDNSTFCNYYRELKQTTEMESYWRTGDLDTWQKETLARWRCGGVVKENRKGFIDTNCRACETSPETIQHVVACEELWQKLSPEDHF